MNGLGCCPSRASKNSIVARSGGGGRVIERERDCSPARLNNSIGAAVRVGGGYATPAKLLDPLEPELVAAAAFAYGMVFYCC